jgi:hypothetical protein
MMKIIVLSALTAYEKPCNILRQGCVLKRAFCPDERANPLLNTSGRPLPHLPISKPLHYMLSIKENSYLQSP